MDDGCVYAVLYIVVVPLFVCFFTFSTPFEANGCCWVSTPRAEVRASYQGCLVTSKRLLLSLGMLIFFSAPQKQPREEHPHTLAWGKGMGEPARLSASMGPVSQWETNLRVSPQSKGDMVLGGGMELRQLIHPCRALLHAWLLGMQRSGTS